MHLISGSNEGEFCLNNRAFCILMRPGREEGKFADKFYDRKVQRHTIARWKVALERLRVGIILEVSPLFLTICIE